jgi:hypothetical protein
MVRKMIDPILEFSLKKNQDKFIFVLTFFCQHVKKLIDFNTVYKTAASLFPFICVTLFILRNSFLLS